MRRATISLAIALSCGGLFACTALLGVKDIYLSGDDASAASDGSGSNPDGNNPADGSNPSDGSAGDGACGDTQGDPANCGRCGHSCLGGQCSAGKCQPVELGRGATGATGIALDATDVYWTTFTGNTVHKVSKNGGQVATLADGTKGASSPYGIFVESGFVYWANHVAFSGTIMRCPVAGCTTPQIVAYNVDEPKSVAVDATNAYFVEWGGLKVTRAPKAGNSDGGVQIFATSAKPEALSLDGDHLVWIDDGSGQAHRIAVDGGDLVDYGANGFDGRDITADAVNAYWVTLTGNVTKRSKDGGGANTSIAVGEGNNLGVVVDATNAYWIKVNFPSDGGLDLAGSIRTCTLSACTPTDFATNQKSPRAIAADATAIYWINYADGSVMKLAKP